MVFRGHVTLSVTWPFDSPYRSFPVGGPLEPNGFRDGEWYAMVDWP